METFVLILHVIIASVMTLFILMQQGKGQRLAHLLVAAALKRYLVVQARLVF
jgi:preprotein translocase subunit SecG